MVKPKIGSKGVLFCGQCHHPLDHRAPFMPTLARTNNYIYTDQESGKRVMKCGICKQLNDFSSTEDEVAPALFPRNTIMITE